MLEDYPSLPKVRPHPEIADVLRDVADARMTTGDALEKLRSIIGSYLWPGASQRHGKIVAELLSSSFLPDRNHGRPVEVLEREWQSLRARPASDLAVDRGVWLVNALAEMSGDKAMSRGAQSLWEDHLERIIGRPPLPYADNGWDSWF